MELYKLVDQCNLCFVKHLRNIHFSKHLQISKDIFYLLFLIDIPSSTLTLGSSLNASNIKEGDDVYFECAVQASPAPYKITWRHNVSISKRNNIC